MRILLFGDSIAQGYYDTENGGWANLLATALMRRKARQTDVPAEFFNLAVSGNFTKHVLARLEQEAKSRVWGDEPMLFIFAVGINDAHLDNGQAVSTPELYGQELEKLYRIAKKLSDTMIFVGLSPVLEAETRPWLFNSGTHSLAWDNSRIRLFDNVLQDFTQRYSLTYVPLFDGMLQQMSAGTSLMMDGLHPNTAGHAYMFGQIQKYLPDDIKEFLGVISKDTSRP